MTLTTKLLVLAEAVVIGFCCTACAPVDEPKFASPTPRVSPNDAVERLPAPPSGMPDGLATRIHAAIDHVAQRDVQVNNGFWTVTHGILGVGLDLMLYDPASNDRVNAFDYIRHGGQIRAMRFIPTEYGLDVQNGPMFVGQGHVDQFVAEMVQVGVTPEEKFVVGGKEYTFLDFIRQAQARVRVTENQELSWSIVAIGHCLGTDITWTNRFGEQLSFEDLVRYELSQDVKEAACGGTHRLFGLAYARCLHHRNGGQDVGVWQEVANKTTQYQNLARELQNPDGSFSTNFFRGPGNDRDITLRLSSTGHTLEWLAFSLTDSQLGEPWVQRAANALALMILETQDLAVEGGTLYHATHALRLYAARQQGRSRIIHHSSAE